MCILLLQSGSASRKKLIGTNRVRTTMYNIVSNMKTRKMVAGKSPELFIAGSLDALLACKNIIKSSQ